MKPTAIFLTLFLAVGVAAAAVNPVGKWHGKLDWTGVTFVPGGKAPTTQPVQSLDLKADHTFVRKITTPKFSRVVSGTWSSARREVTMVHAVVDGKSMAGKPMHFTLSADGKALDAVRAKGDLGPILKYKRP